MLFYAVSAAGNLLVVTPLSMGSVFVDAAGERWAIPSILWVSRLVSIFLMMPLSLIAWVKASRPVLDSFRLADHPARKRKLFGRQSVPLACDNTSSSQLRASAHILLSLKPKISRPITNRRPIGLRGHYRSRCGCRSSPRHSRADRMSI